MPDISSELDTIKNDVKGANVKQAIYDALVKVNEAKIPKPEPQGPIIGAASVAANGGMQYTIGTAINGSLWDYVQETDDEAKTTATLTIVAAKNALLVAAVMHRNENASISGDGWTLVRKSSGVLGNVSQWVSIWTKPVSAGSHTITVTQESSARMNLKLIVLYGAQSVSVVDDVLLQTAAYTPTAASGKRRLYMISSTYAGSIPDTYSASDYGNLDLQSAIEKRFMVWYDYQPSMQITPTFTYQLGNYEANTSEALTLDINEEE